MQVNVKNCSWFERCLPPALPSFFSPFLPFKEFSFEWKLLPQCFVALLGGRVPLVRIPYEVNQCSTASRLPPRPLWPSGAPGLACDWSAGRSQTDIKAFAVCFCSENREWRESLSVSQTTVRMCVCEWESVCVTVFFANEAKERDVSLSSDMDFFLFLTFSRTVGSFLVIKAQHRLEFDKDCSQSTFQTSTFG